MAQLVAQRTLNPWVEGSSPSRGTKNQLEVQRRIKCYVADNTSEMD